MIVGLGIQAFCTKKTSIVGLSTGVRRAHCDRSFQVRSGQILLPQTFLRYTYRMMGFTVPGIGIKSKFGVLQRHVILPPWQGIVFRGWYKRWLDLTG
jgi:hypothetical protein